LIQLCRQAVSVGSQHFGGSSRIGERKPTAARAHDATYEQGHAEEADRAGGYAGCEEPAGTDRKRLSEGVHVDGRSVLNDNVEGQPGGREKQEQPEDRHDVYLRLLKPAQRASAEGP